MDKILIIGKNSFVGKNFKFFSKFKLVEEVSLLETKPGDIDFTGIDVVLHLAAIVHSTKKIPEAEYLRVNRDLCVEVAMKAKSAGVKQFVFLSTTKVYGNFIKGSGPWNENSECLPDDSYGKSKYEAELALKKNEDTDFIVSIVRTPIIYGDGVSANMLKLVRLVERFPVLPFGNMNNIKHMTYIENLVAFIDEIIVKKASGIFLVMDDSAISTTQLVKQIAKYLNRKLILISFPGLLVSFGTYLLPAIFDRLYGSAKFDNELTRERLKFSPPVSVEEGLRRMVTSYLVNKG